MTPTTWLSPRSPSQVVELSVGFRIRTDPDQAEVIAARLIEALEGTVDLTFRARNVPSGPAASEVAELDVPEHYRQEPAVVEPVLRLQVESRRVLLLGVVVSFTRLEFDLLLFLCTHPDRVLDRDTLMSEVWGMRGVVGDRRTVDVHVRRLRMKLGSESPLITTVRGVGYRFEGSERVWVERTCADQVTGSAS
jgi:DNA-binding response OmpR family regulator